MTAVNDIKYVNAFNDNSAKGRYLIIMSTASLTQIGTIAVSGAAGWTVVSATIGWHEQTASFGVTMGVVRAATVGDKELSTVGHTHSASDITTDTFADARIPNLAASKITSGTFAVDRIPSLDASKIDSGTFGAARLADNSVTNAKIADGTIADNKLASTFVKPSEFGAIAYSGLDGAEASVFPTSYRQGGAPALPEPKKAGQEFLGWTWDGQASPTKNGDVIKSAFSVGNKTVTMTANWGAVQSNYFFGGNPYDAVTGAGDTSPVIQVKLAGDGSKALTALSFTRKNADLVKDDADITFDVANNKDMTGAKTGIALGGSMEGTLTPDGSGMVYIRAHVPAGALNGDAVAPSFTAGDYVASFVTLSYSF